jgi:polysaccharide biosynthesis transport protein
MPTVAAEPELGTYLAVLWRRRWSILMVGALVALAAYAYASRQAPVYRSQTEVLVRPIVLIPSDPSSGAEVNMDDEQRVATSNEVADQAARRIGGPVDVHQVTIDTAATSHTLTFTASAATAQEARALAQSMADAYLDLRQQQGIQQLNAAMTPLKSLLGQLARKRASLELELTQTSDPDQKSVLQTQLSTLIGDEATATGSLFRLVRPGQLHVGEVLRPAPLPSGPAVPDYPKTAAFALFVALCLGVAVAFVRERLDDDIRGRHELEALLGVRVLVPPPAAPARRRLRLPFRRRTAARAGLADGEVDASYAALARHVLAANFRQPLPTLLVTDTGVGEAGSLVAANLGVALAHAGKSVILLPTDVQAPKLRRHFSVPEGGAARRRAGEDPAEGVRGPSELVPRDDRRLGRSLRPLRDRLTMLLPPGIELLDRPSAEKLLIEAREVAELVLLDIPPVLRAPEALALAGMADAVLLVVDAKRSTQTMALATKEQLERTGTRVIGAVLSG